MPRAGFELRNSCIQLAARPVPRATGRPPGQPPTASLLRIFRHAGSLQPSVLFRKNNNVDKWVSLADCCLRHVSHSCKQHRHKAHSTGFNLTAPGCRGISDEHEILLESYAVSIGNSLPTFRRNVLPSSSGTSSPNRERDAEVSKESTVIVFRVKGTKKTLPGLHDPESGRQYVSSKRRQPFTSRHDATSTDSLSLSDCHMPTTNSTGRSVPGARCHTMSTSRGSSTTALITQR